MGDRGGPTGDRCEADDGDAGEADEGGVPADRGPSLCPTRRSGDKGDELGECIPTELLGDAGECEPP